MIPARNINNDSTGKIISIICEAWGVSRPDLVGRSRRRPLPWARSMLCEYLRRYAGHDTVSCAALLHMSPEGVSCYGQRYTYLLRTYVSFRDRDTIVKQHCQQLKQQKECTPTK